MTNTETLKNSVARRLKYLVLLQAGEKFRLKGLNKKKAAFKIFLKAITAVAVTGILFFIFNYMKKSFGFSFDRVLFTTVLLFTQVISIITCAGSMMSVLYNGRENAILMAFPCNYNEIFVSKIVVFILEELKKSIYFVIPFLISYGMVSSAGASYWIGFIPTWLFLTLFPVLFSAVFSIPAIFVKKFLENHSTLFAALVIIFLAGIFALVIYVLSFVPSPFRLVANYYKISVAFRKMLLAINKFSLFYAFIGNAMFGHMVWLFLPLTLVIFVAAGALCFLVAMPFYFKAASSSAENSKTSKHRVGKTHLNNLFFTFFRKEVKLMFRSSKNVNSAISIVLVFPILSYILNFIVAAMRTSMYGDYMIIAFNLMITLSLISTYNANCAAAISSEGSEFAVLKAAPSNTMIVTWAKLALTMIVNLLSVASMCVVISLTTDLKTMEIVRMFLIIVPVSLGNILWSFQLDVTNPKVNDYAVKGDAVVDNPNVAKSLVIGFVVSTIAGILSLLLLIDSYSTGWLRVIIVAYVYFAIRLYLYSSNLKVYFNDIQG